MDYEKWMQTAEKAINGLPSGTVFPLKMLFVGTDWEALSKGDRLNLGKYFKNQVCEKNIKEVEFLGKYSNNSAKYLRK